MMKILNICWKDIRITIHDRAALLMMLVAPLALTLGLGAVTGAFSRGQTTGLQNIPVVIANQDEGQLGNFLVEAFQSEEVGGLFKTEELKTEKAARLLVEEDQVAAAVLIPAGFSASLLPNQRTGLPGPAAPVEIVSNPTRPVSASVVQSVVHAAIQQLETGPVSGRIAIQGLLESGRLSLQEVPAYAAEMQDRLAMENADQGLIEVQTDPGYQPEPDEQGSFLAYLAPGMAVFFLMYTVTYGGRSLLAERDGGTLSRLLVTPTSSAQVLGGKVLAIFVAGLLQVGILVLASSLMLRLHWGDPLGVALLVVCVTAAATGWGTLLAAVATTPFQVNSLGTALMLFFGLLGGTFIPAANFSGAVRLLSKITPNAWAMDGFAALGGGAILADIADSLAALLIMAALLFGLAILFSRRRWANGLLRK